MLPLLYTIQLFPFSVKASSERNVDTQLSSLISTDLISTSTLLINISNLNQHRQHLTDKHFHPAINILKVLLTGTSIQQTTRPMNQQVTIQHAHGAPLTTTEEQEQVLTVHHWTDKYFSFTTTRNDGLRFENGQFVMLGLEIDGKLVRRAYSVASANWEEELEFFSIKVENGKLTSHLQNIKPGDYIHVGRKPVGTLLLDDLTTADTVWMLATGTGLAAFMSLIKDPDVYERFNSVVLVHGVRHVEDLAYKDLIKNELPEHPYLGEQISKKLRYVPVVSRDPYTLHGRITELLETGALEASVGRDAINPANDRIMICGGMAMLDDLSNMLDARGFVVSPSIGEPGDYVFERAFVSR